MSEAARLNNILERDAPAVLRCLSAIGREAAFPKGIPFQAAAASKTEINATIGQMTDGHGHALPLSVMESLVVDLDTSMTFLYAPVEGHRAVREAWRDRERRLAGVGALPSALPIATHGLTHGLSLVATMFGDENTTLVLPTPHWGNYRLIFQIHGDVPRAGWEFFKDGGFNLDGLADTLATLTGKAILVLNLPGNPTGYALSQPEADGLVALLKDHPHPLVIVVDDAYQGFVYEEDRQVRSLFWDVAKAVDLERHVVLKVDGATKELLFFSSRLGFLTHPYVSGEAEDALLSKFKYLIRGTVGSPPGPSQALVLRALGNPHIEAAFADRLAMMQRRYKALKAALAENPSETLVPYPFNAAFFMLMKVKGMDSDEARQRLIDEASVGTIAFADPNALRIAHCSVDEHDIPEMVHRIVRVLG